MVGDYNRGCAPRGGCCHQQCLGGCAYPDSPSDCYVCKNIFYNGTCMEKCPSMNADNETLYEVKTTHSLPLPLPISPPYFVLYLPTSPSRPPTPTPILPCSPVPLPPSSGLHTCHILFCISRSLTADDASQRDNVWSLTRVASCTWVPALCSVPPARWIIQPSTGRRIATT